MSKIRVLTMYQVIMHYRLPLYYRLSNDASIDFTLLYGEGSKGTKLKNANFENSKLKAIKLFTFRIPYKTTNGSGTIPIWPNLIIQLIKNNPDVILCEGTSSLFNALVAFIYAKAFRKKFIWWSLGKLKNREYFGFRRALVNLENYIAKHADAIFTYSSLGKNYFLSIGVNIARIFVAVNVLDTEVKLTEIEKYSTNNHPWQWANKFNIAFIGSITKEKNLEVVLNTMKIYRELNIDDIIFHIIGDGYHLEILKEMIIKEGIEELVIIHGRIEEGASAILSNCHVMVLPGLGGLSICEGMLNKLPIITGDADGTELDLVTEDNGFYLSKMSSEILKDKIDFLKNNKKIITAMADNSFNKITNEFHFNRYYEILKETISFVNSKK